MRADAETRERALPLVLIFLVIIFSPLVYDLIHLIGRMVGWE